MLVLLFKDIHFQVYGEWELNENGEGEAMFFFSETCNL